MYLNRFHKYATDSNAYHIAHFIRHADERFYIELQDEQGGGTWERGWVVGLGTLFIRNPLDFTLS